MPRLPDLFLIPHPAPFAGRFLRILFPARRNLKSAGCFVRATHASPLRITGGFETRPYRKTKFRANT